MKLKKQKIYTEVKLCMPTLKSERDKAIEYNGKLSLEDFELIWDLLEVVWHLEDGQELVLMKKTLGKIRKIVANYNKEMDNL